MAPLQTIVVVGTSLAGLRAVETLRARGYDGRIIWVGEETRLPYDRPPLSKELLRGDWDADRTALRKNGSYQDLEAEVRLGCRANGLEPSQRCVRLSDGSTVRYDGLVIATGASARRLPDAPPLAGIHVLRSLDDALAVRRALEHGPRVAIVGAGFIGAEVAASCRSLGLEVTLVEALPTPLARALDPELGRVLEAVHRDRGVVLRLGRTVTRFEGGRGIEQLQLDDGSRIPADLVVVGIGVTPEVGWLRSSGLSLSDGVLCDASLGAGAPGVVAAGDVVRWHHPDYAAPIRLEHWTNAVEQGTAAAQRLLAGDGPVEPFALLPFVWSDQYDVKLQIAGETRDAQERRIVHGSIGERRFLVLYGKAGRLRGAVAFSRPRQLMQYRRLMREGISFQAAVAHAES